MKKTTVVIALIVALFGVAVILILFTKGKSDSLSGIITRIDYNCMPSKILSANGEVTTDSGNVVCDAGTFVTIDNIKIQTASGNVIETSQFNTDISSLQPGDKVHVKYQTKDGGPTLNCDDCFIKRL